MLFRFYSFFILTSAPRAFTFSSPNVIDITRPQLRPECSRCVVYQKRRQTLEESYFVKALRVTQADL